VSRLFWLVVHNWPLKLAAIGLATLLYGGLVLSESASTLDVNIPIDPKGQPSNTFILQDLPPVTEVRYVSPSGARAISSTFTATVDLSGMVPGSGPKSVPVVVQSIDDRINVIDFTPDFVTVQLDELKTKTVPVTVDPGTIPEGWAIGTPQFSPTEVDVSGPASVVANVVAARASPVVQTSGLSIDQSLPLTPIDRLGDAVSPVKVEPDSARVKISVFPTGSSRSVVVHPIVTGDPAAGFEILDITVDPLSVNVAGKAERLAALESIDTQPVSVSGASSTVQVTVGLDPPDDVTPISVTTVDVTVTFRPVTSTRNFEVGYRLVGADSDLRYSVPVDRIAITVGGSKADLDKLDGSTLVADLDVSGIDPGTSNMIVLVDLPPGLTLVSATPATIPVTVTVPPPPSPSPSAPDLASPSASPAG
jgi:YbbR domain-containing protein